MASELLKVIPGFYAKYLANKLFISAITYEIIFMSKEYCIAHHDAKIRFSPNSRYRICLLGNVEEFLQKVQPLCFTYQHVDCLYTLFKCRFSGNFVVTGYQKLHNVQRAVYFKQRNRRVNKMPSIAKTKLLRKNDRKHFLSSFRKTK